MMNTYQKINKQFANYEDYHNYNADNLHWLKALHFNTEEFYKYYFETFPNGLFCQQAKDRFIALHNQRLIDEQKNKVRADNQQWENSVRINTESSYLEYISRFPQGIHIIEAKKQLDELENRHFLKEKDEKSWQEASNVDTEQSYQEYLNKFPQGKFANSAKSRRDNLKRKRLIEEERLLSERKRKEREERKKRNKGYTLIAIAFSIFLGLWFIFFYEVVDEVDHYQINDDGTVKDPKTGLVWQRCTYGQRWNGSGCSGEPKNYFWYDAIKIRDNFAGYSDWRLPNIDELGTLIYCSSGKTKGIYPGRLKGWDTCEGYYRKPAINTTVFPMEKQYYAYHVDDWFKADYWSSSPYVDKDYKNYARGISFGDGSNYARGKATISYIRLVRGGQ